jgi:hypothetical protein
MQICATGLVCCRTGEQFAAARGEVLADIAAPAIAALPQFRERMT